MRLLESQMIDNFGRVASNLRISVTDKCNLRCSYCITNDNNNWAQTKDLLTFSEIIRLVNLFAQLGVIQLRITGGEPLVRPGVPNLIKNLRSIPGIKRISMTSNGVLLADKIDELVNAGLSSINISLDTLDARKFQQITGKNHFDIVFNSILKAKKSDLRVKVNVVAIKDFNDMEVLEFTKFAIKHDITVRFIEFMPFRDNRWSIDNLVSVNEIKSIISKKYTLLPEPLEHSAQTSRVFNIKGFKGRVGLIASVTESFCQFCNRLRLTADGNLRSCLNSKNEAHLRELIRSGISNKELTEIIVNAVRNKPKEHDDFLDPEYQPPKDDREMMRIGG
ncbi:MAG: GTP 3',8-cyclase MoaA [Candidatus Kariarchaeaceae archaeon]